MQNKRFIIYLFCAFCWCLPVMLQAQVIKNTSASIKKADRFFERAQYGPALEFYFEALENEKENNQLRLKVAECYRMLDRPEVAEKWYRTFMDNDAFVEVQPSELKYHFGLVLESNGKYEEAREWFEIYALAAPSDRRVMAKLNALNNLELHYQDSSLYEVSELGINTRNEDFSAHFLNRGIVFVSDRKTNENTEAGLYDTLSYNALFYSEIRKEGRLGEPVLFGKELSEGFHAGPVAFYDENRSIIFSRSNKSRAMSAGRFDLYLAQRAIDSDRWVKIRPFPFNSRDGSFSTMHPSVSEDGTQLYFASDRPGGFGGYDIYVCESDGNGGWKEPRNLGELVNTQESELYPHIFQDSILYFTSRGHGGLGGMDIFEVNLTASQSPINLGFPINTNKNDFAFAISKRGHLGYFSSNRDGGKGGADLYRFTKNMYIQGKVSDEKDATAVANAHVLLANTRNGQVIGAVTDNEGNYRIKLQVDAAYEMTVFKKGFQPVEPKRVSTYGELKSLEEYNIKVQTLDLICKGRVTDRENGSPMEGIIVSMLNTKTGKDMVVSTDERGEYIFKIQPESWYALRVEYPGYLTEKLEINAYQQKSGDLVHNFTLKKLLFNEYQLLENTTYVSNKADIGPESEEELDKLALFIMANPHVIVEFKVYTDCRGEEADNKKLSDDRAKYIMYHLVKRGVMENQISAVGCGAASPINHCTTGVECTEEEHKVNRRVEFLLKDHSRVEK